MPAKKTVPRRKNAEPDVSETLIPKTRIAKAVMEARRKVIAAGYSLRSTKEIQRDLKAFREGK